MTLFSVIITSVKFQIKLLSAELCSLLFPAINCICCNKLCLWNCTGLFHAPACLLHRPAPACFTDCLHHYCQLSSVSAPAWVMIAPLLSAQLGECTGLGHDCTTIVSSARWVHLIIYQPLHDSFSKLFECRAGSIGGHSFFYTILQLRYVIMTLF